MPWRKPRNKVGSHLFNRVDGQPLFPIEYCQYPASNIPGEVTGLRSRCPLWPAPYARQKLTDAMLTSRTPEAHAWAVQRFKTFRSDGQFVPFSLAKQTIIFPGFDGGGEWGGPAVDPTTGVLYVNANEMAWTGGLAEDNPGGSPGAALYQSQCAVCHGIDRDGSPPAYPSLIGIDKRLTDQQIATVIDQGKGRMPSFSGLHAAQLTSLLDYLKVRRCLHEHK